ncbi:MAG: glycosyltransferase family 4 protein [Candidatus Omnitrophica bacterium]|nr:glycosyltransferase family 4 protein [Candidatus Omnitrophota bacterium]
MNILYLTTHLNTGGITSYLLSLCRAMKSKGHNVYLASSGGDCLLKFEQEGVKFVPISIKTKAEISPKILISLRQLALLIKQENIQIVHSNTRVTQVLAELLRRFYSVKHISTCHGFFRMKLSRRLFSCWGDKVVAISSQVRDHLVNDLGVPANKIAIVHNGIDIDKFRVKGQGLSDKEKQAMGLGGGPVIGIIARLSDVKGHIYLIQAMKTVLEKFPAATLLIVGEGKERGRLIQLASSLGIEKQVIFISSVSDTRHILSVLDVFVMPSLHEGLGLALMEAMAFGLPVIGSKVGGILSLIEDGKSGILVESRDVVGLSVALIKVLSDNAAAKSLGENAARFIGNNFGLEKMAEETERVYVKCLEK